MQKISSITATATPEGLFTNGSVAAGVSPTILDAAWFNTIQTELVTIVQAAGITLDSATDTQVLAALKLLFLSRSSPFADIKADGAAALAAARSNLGLGTAALKAIGTAALQVPDMSSFGSTANGQYEWDILPNGMLRQMGTVSLTASGNFNSVSLGGVTYYTHYYRITYPRTFPNAQVSVTATLASASYTAQGSMAGRSVTVNRDTDDGTTVSKTRFVLAYTTTVLGEVPTIHYSAIGY